MRTTKVLKVGQPELWNGALCVYALRIEGDARGSGPYSNSVAECANRRNIFAGMWRYHQPLSMISEMFYCSGQHRKLGNSKIFAEDVLDLVWDDFCKIGTVTNWSKLHGSNVVALSTLFSETLMPMQSSFADKTLAGGFCVLKMKTHPRSRSWYP